VLVRLFITNTSTLIAASIAESGGLMEERVMNKEYLIAKADLCKDLAIEQISNGDSEAGVENLKRMIKALEEINFINYLEEKRGL
jgi:hypothetical protein